MDFLEELRWRGMLHDQTPGLDEELAKDKMLTAYIGYDPTAPSLTIGNLVTIMLLVHWQRAGHRPVIVMGGATGRIGDPSGKDEERQLLPLEKIQENLENMQKVFSKLLNFEEGDNKATIIDNYTFYNNMKVLDFLRDVGKHLTVNYLMSKDSVKNRLESGLSFTEFSYQLIQAYDFKCLYEQENCTVQMGGSDQWGNIVSGTELIRRMSSGKAHAVTCPLLMDANGKKIGKSVSGGTIWLNAANTSPYKFYQYWLGIADADVSKLLRTFSLKSREEIEAIENNHAAEPHLRIGQKAIAEEITIRLHGQEAFDAALQVSELIFNKKLNKDTLTQLSEQAFESLAKEITHFEVNDFGEDILLLDLLAVESKALASKADVRRAIKGNALGINKVKISDQEAKVSKTDLIHGKYLFVENGKKNKFLLTLK